MAFSQQPTVIAPQLDLDCCTVDRQHGAIRWYSRCGIRQQSPQSVRDLDRIRTRGRSRDRHQGMREQQHHQKRLGDHDHLSGRRTSQ
jgi:hypothetical protein